eukprot:TCONS_00022815-protein
MSTYISIANAIKEIEYWLRLATLLHEPLKESLLNILHNYYNRTDYVGLPSNPNLLNAELRKHQHRISQLQTKRVLNKDQVELLLPTASTQTDSSTFDVTLIIFLIIEFTNLPPPSRGWKKDPLCTDTSLAAFVLRARKWRNDLLHDDPKSITLNDFNKRWTEGVNIIHGLFFVTYDTNRLKTMPLDVHNRTVFKSLKFLSKKITGKQTAHDNQLASHDNKLTAHDNQLTTQDNKLTAHDNQLTTQDNKLTAHDNQLTTQDNKLTAHDNQLTTQDNKLAAHDNQLTTQDSKLIAHDNQFTNQDNKLTAHDDHFTAHHSQLNVLTERLSEDESKFVEMVDRLEKELNFIKDNLKGNQINERQKLGSKEIRLERNLYKDVQITLNVKNLNIANITAIDVGKEVDEKTEIVYEGLQQNEYLTRPLNDRLLVQIHKEMASGFVHSIKMKTLQTDGTNEEFVVNVKGRDMNHGQRTFTVDKTLIYTHNSGLDDNVHHYKPTKPITEEQECRPIRTGPSITKTVADFRERSLQYFTENTVAGERHFPPSYYLKNGNIKDWLEKLDKMEMFKNVKFLTQYHPRDHLYLMGLDDKDCDEIITAKHKLYDDVILVVDFDRHLVMVCSIIASHDRETLYQEIRTLNDVTKTIIHVASDDIKNDYVTILSVPVLLAVDAHTLNLYSIFNENFLSCSGMLVTKNDLDCTRKLETKLESFCGKASSEMASIKRKGACSRDLTFLNSFSGQIMSSMASTTQYLPKISENVPEKIDTILLNHNQINLINDPTKWKIIKGPFGSGKSVSMYEIARNLMHQTDQLYYITFDPFSLVDLKFQEGFDNLCDKEKLDKSKIKAFSIGDALEGSTIDISDVYNMMYPPRINLCRVLEYLYSDKTKRVGFMIDEFPNDFLTTKYAENLKESLVKNFQDTPVILALQSVEKRRQVVKSGFFSDDVKQVERCDYHRTGMKVFILDKTMRMAVNIHQMIEIFQEEIEKEIVDVPLEYKTLILRRPYAPSARKTRKAFKDVPLKPQEQKEQKQPRPTDDVSLH